MYIDKTLDKQFCIHTFNISEFLLFFIKKDDKELA